MSLTVREIAEKEGVGEQCIRNQIGMGYLKGRMISRRAGYRVEESDYEEWRKRGYIKKKAENTSGN